MSSIVFREYYPHTGSAPFICPSISTWRKSAILETPEENFLPGRNSRCTFSQTPLTPTWEKSGKLTPPPEKFFQHVSHRLMSKNELLGKLFRKVFQIVSHKYQQLSITHANPASITSCQRLPRDKYSTAPGAGLFVRPNHIFFPKQLCPDDPIQIRIDGQHAFQKIIAVNSSINQSGVFDTEGYVPQ